MKIALLHRMFALLLAVGFLAGPVVHAAIPGGHCLHAAEQQAPGDHSSDESSATHSPGDSGQCEDHGQLCSSCFVWAVGAGQSPHAAPQDQLAATDPGWRHDQSRVFQLDHANSARGPPLI